MKTSFSIGKSFNVLYEIIWLTSEEILDSVRRSKQKSIFFIDGFNLSKAKKVDNFPYVTVEFLE